MKPNDNEQEFTPEEIEEANDYIEPHEIVKDMLHPPRYSDLDPIGSVILQEQRLQKFDISAAVAYKKQAAKVR
jgi:hypothetical protein